MNTVMKSIMMALLFGYGFSVVSAHKECESSVEIVTSVDKFTHDVADKAKKIAGECDPVVSSVIDEIVRKALDNYKKEHKDEHKHAHEQVKKADKIFFVDLYERIVAEIRKAVLDSTGTIIKTTTSVIALLAGVSLAISFVLVLDDYTGCIPAFGKFVLIPLVSRGAEILQRVAQIGAEATLNGMSEATGLPIGSLLQQLNTLTNATGSMIAGFVRTVTFQ